MPEQPIKIAAKISLLYSLVSGLWILFSDRMVEAFFPGTQELTYFQTYKGLSFVCITALLLYALMRDQLRKHEAQSAERERAQAQFRESEYRFRQITESLPQLVWTCTPDGECDFLSRQWVEFTGVQAEEQLGRRWLQQIHPDDRKRLAAAWAANVASGQSFQTEYRLRSRDGTYRWFDHRAVPLRNAEGKIVKWYGSNTDIHAEHELRESLRASEEKLRTLFEAEPECLQLLEPDGTVREINPAGLRILEAESLASVLGRSVLDRVLPEHRVSLLVALAATASGEPRTLEFEIRGGQGTLRWLEMNAVPFRDPGTGKDWILGVSRDITERRHTQEALRLSQERLRACIENTPNVALQWYDQDGRVLYWNQASERVFGWRPDEALGKTRDQLMQSAEQAARFRENLRSLSQSGQILGPMESEFHRRDGSAGVCLSTFFAIPFDSQTACFVSMDVDVTELRRSRNHAEQSLSLLSATLESTAEGILVVDRQRRITSYNRKFAQMWRLPESVLQTGDAEQALAYVLDQLPDPDSFRAGVRTVYESPESSSQDVIGFKDGRVFERDSQPQRLGGNIVGRVWSFRDVTERRRVEQLVVQSERRLQLVWEQAPLALRLADARGTTVRVNPSYCELVGKSRAELEGQPFTAAYAEKDRDQAMAQYRRSFENHAEGRQRPADVTFGNGRRARLEVSDSFLEVTGQPTYLLTILNDVTVRHQAERRVSVFATMAQALSAANSRQAAAEIIAEAAQTLLGWDACFFHRYDPEKEQVESILSRKCVDGKVVDVPLPAGFRFNSPAVQEILSQGPKLSLPKDFAPEAEPQIPSGESQRLPESVISVPVPEGGRAVGILSLHSYSPQAYDSASLAMLQSLAEHGAGALERMRAEEILQTRERQFRSLIENNSDMITVVNRAGRLGFQSPSVERVLGYQPDELTGRSVLEFVHPEDVPAARDALVRVVDAPHTTSSV